MGGKSRRKNKKGKARSNFHARAKGSAYHEQRKRRRLNPSDGSHRDGRSTYVDLAVDKNSLFSSYYSAQNVVATAEELEDMLAYFRKGLVASIRVHAGSPYFHKIQKYLSGLAESYPRVLASGEVLREAPRRLPWYPGGCAWCLGTDRVMLRKDPALKDIHRFLVRESQTDNVCRQEEVSMMPPLLLDIQPHHFCLDLCAAPGNKTGQMLEALHSKDKENGPATGFVVANDADSKRAYMLHHQLKPYSSPNLFICCQEAQYFPLIGAYDGETSTVRAKSLGLFDRILADVPCSGDGTLRKISGIWEKWDPNQSLSLHPLQVMIGVKGAHLLKEGGLMVYSTCTINPIEDEAVVAQILRRCGGALELVDCSGKFPQLKTRKGLTTWKVAAQVTDREMEQAFEAGELQQEFDKTDGARPWKKLRFYETHEEFLEHRKQHHVRKGNLRFPKTMTPSMWPGSAEEMQAMKLDRCMRILPHDQNTGGFFMCLLRKVGPIPPWNGSHTNLKSADETVDEISKKNSTDKEEKSDSLINESTKSADKADAEKVSASNRSAKEKGRSTGDMAVDEAADTQVPDYLPVEKELWDDVKEQYGIKDEEDGGTFPPRSQLFYRPATIRGERDTTVKKHPKHISLVAKSLQENFMRPGIQQRLYVISAGLHIFKRNDRREGCKYRVSSEGLRVTKGEVPLQVYDWSALGIAKVLN